MKIHLGVRREGPFGGSITGSLCRRLNRASIDGMNLGSELEVTCAFCRRLMTLRKPMQGFRRVENKGLSPIDSPLVPLYTGYMKNIAIGSKVRSTRVIATMSNIYPTGYELTVTAIHDDGSFDAKNGSYGISRLEADDVELVQVCLYADEHVICQNTATIAGYCADHASQGSDEAQELARAGAAA